MVPEIQFEMHCTEKYDSLYISVNRQNKASVLSPRNPVEREKCIERLRDQERKTEKDRQRQTKTETEKERQGERGRKRDREREI